MGQSSITITFNEDADVGDVLNFAIQAPGGVTPVYKPETFQLEPSTQIGEIQVPNIGGNPAGYATAAAYWRWWGTHYARLINGKGSIIGINSNVVTITFINPIEGVCPWDILDWSSTVVGITAVINNCSDTAPSFNVTLVSFDEAVSPCGSVEVSITTDELATKVSLITGNNEVLLDGANVSNPFVVDIPRDAYHRFKLENAGGDVIYKPSYQELLYNIGSWTINEIDVSPGLSGSTITVSVLAPVSNPNPTLVFEYSLDDSIWQSSNIFLNQADATYTIYVRDQYGCKKNKQVIVTGLGTRDPFLYISQANGITFVENEEVDGCTIFRNDNNALAHQGLEDIKFCDTILLQTCDTSKIQFKSNYDTPTVFLRNEDGSPDVEISLQKKSANLNRFERMDCWYYEYKSGKLGIYFTSGNTYDVLDAELDTFTLNGNLPDFAIVGTFIDITGLGVFEIKDVVFDPVIGKKAIIVDFTYSGIAIQTRVESYFDLLPFEIYEFEIDWSIIGEGLYDVLINNTDANNGTVQHLSENIWIQDEHTKTLAIRYFNANNRDVFYKYGIQHFIRAQYLHVEGVALDETEINITDLSSQVIDSSVHEVDKFYFDEVSKGMMRKLVVALSCETIYINGQGYIKQGKLEVENAIGTNAYTIIASMLKTNINYNNNRQGQDGYDEDNIAFDIAPFVFGSGGFVKT